MLTAWKDRKQQQIFAMEDELRTLEQELKLSGERTLNVTLRSLQVLREVPLRTAGHAADALPPPRGAFRALPGHSAPPWLPSTGSTI